jgi:hypothetical protein
VAAGVLAPVFLVHGLLLGRPYHKVPVNYGLLLALPTMSFFLYWFYIRKRTPAGGAEWRACV